MSPEDRQILDLFAVRVRGLEARTRIWAFGSRARGDADRDSDFDVCVVLPNRTLELRRAISEAAWEIGYEHDRVITTVVLSEDEFERGPMSASPLVREIRREGLAA